MKRILILCLLSLALLMPTETQAGHGRLGSRVARVLRGGARVAARPFARVRERRAARGARGVRFGGRLRGGCSSGSCGL